MVIHRRHFLRLCGITGIGTLAGCNNSSGDDGTAKSDENGSQSPTDTRISASQQAKLVADDGDEGDQFGRSMAVSSDGTTALIGAEADEDPNGEGAGSAYVFEASGGSWTQKAKLAPDDADSEDAFGISVALSSDGTTALIGAVCDEDPNGREAGSAYVFEASGGSWTQKAKLAPDDGDSEDRFGSSVAMSSDGATAIIGADNDEDPNGDSAGSAYVFEASGGSWTQQAKLFADDGDSRDSFGRSMAVSSDGTTALIGASYDDNPNGDKAGSAYVFEASGGSWTQKAKLIADDGDSEDRLGRSVAVSSDGTTAIIGASQDEDPNGKWAGSAYVFEATSGAWTQQAKLSADDGESWDSFGYSVAVSSDGTIAIICAHGCENPNGDDAGSVYVFEAISGSWTQQAKFTADDGDEHDHFGMSVGVSSDGTTTVIGASEDEDPNGSSSGSAYVFSL